MNTKEYLKKRNFNKTTEPVGSDRPKGEGMHFVIHKHSASHEHYDLRLEVGGVLKSWAIPKGPSLDPAKKHLAVMVEDHPYGYKDFEGVIPKGNYGAGEVIIWDEGFYRPVGALAKGQLKKSFSQGLDKGHLVFILGGKKLNGEFALIKLKKGGENDWLFIKANDQFASDEEILREDKSVKSGKTIEDMKNSANQLLNGAPRQKFPHLTKPMLATLEKKPFDSPDWSFEIKWDGYRVIAEIENGEVNLYSRNHKLLNEKFPTIYSSLKGHNKDMVLDGEVAAVDNEGRSNFELLGRGRRPSANVIYFVFDLIYYDGHALIDLPLNKRRSVLNEVLPKNYNIRFSQGIKSNGEAFFKAAKEKELEGIIAKKNNSKYIPGTRTKNWLKIKTSKQQEVIICGYTKPEGTRTGFGSLVGGIYKKGELIYVGNVGTGFSAALIQELKKTIDALVTDTSPFKNPPRLKDVVWLKPKLVMGVRFQEWTSSGNMRQPVFVGLRDDKVPKEVTWEDQVAKDE